MNQEKSQEENKKEGIWSSIVWGMITLTIFMLIKIFLVQPYVIPSASMENTLNIGDMAVVNKLDTRPEKGDVIVFEGNHHWNHDGDEKAIFIKRVIGVPGDTVGGCSSDGKLIINGSPMQENYLKNQEHVGCKFPQTTLGKDEYWVMGDNRSNSADSRAHSTIDGQWDSHKGAISQKQIKGTMFWHYETLFNKGFLLIF